MLAWPGLVGPLWGVVFARRRHEKGHADTAPGTGERGRHRRTGWPLLPPLPVIGIAGDTPAIPGA